MKQKNFEKKGDAYRKKYSQELVIQVGSFIDDCKGKTDKEIKDLYERYDGIWRRFANRMNDQHRSADGIMIIGFTDAFEENIHSAYSNLKDAATLSKEDFTHYKRVVKLFSKRNFIQRLLDRLRAVNFK